MSDMENGMGPRQSLMEILGMNWGWVGNECGIDRRIGHGYDKPLNQSKDLYLSHAADTSCHNSLYQQTT